MLALSARQECVKLRRVLEEEEIVQSTLLVSVLVLREVSKGNEWKERYINETGLVQFYTSKSRIKPI